MRMRLPAAAALAAFFLASGLAAADADLRITRDQFMAHLIGAGLEHWSADMPDYEGLSVTSVTVTDPFMSFTLFGKPDGALVEGDLMMDASPGGEMAKGGVVLFLMGEVFPDWDFGVDWVTNALKTGAPKNSIKRNGIRVIVSRPSDKSTVHLVIGVPED